MKKSILVIFDKFYNFHDERKNDDKKKKEEKLNENNEHLDFILESLEHCQEDDNLLKKNEDRRKYNEER